MALTEEDKRGLFNNTLEIVKQAAGSGSSAGLQNGAFLADMFETVYEKLKSISEKDGL